MMNYYSQLHKRKAQNGDEGFTLIELLIVIVVLGILAAVVVFALGSVTHNAKSSACAADAKTVETAVGVYNAQNSNGITTETVDVITVGSTAGIVAGQPVIDTTRSASTTVVALISGTTFSVPAGVTASWVSGDAMTVNAVSHPITGLASGAAGFTAGTPATYATAVEAQLLLTSGVLRSWPGTSQGYAVSLSASKAGNITIYVPATNVTGVDFESETATTGCNNPLL